LQFTYGLDQKEQETGRRYYVWNKISNEHTMKKTTVLQPAKIITIMKLLLYENTFSGSQMLFFENLLCDPN